MTLLDFAKKTYFLIHQYYVVIRNIFIKEPVNFKDIPIIINNYNRVTFLKRLIQALETRGYNNIIIIDNNSDYPPLLEYYIQLKYPIHRLKNNIGFKALWKTGLYKKYHNKYFVYTDSDVVMDKDCPDDFMYYFYSLMKKYPRAVKVGFSLKIDDLPDCFDNKQKVIKFESPYWQKVLEADVYRAPIDTTFALYKPYCGYTASKHDFIIRTGGKYTALHLPWYNDSANLSDEEKYYISHINTSTEWTKLAK